MIFSLRIYFLVEDLFIFIFFKFFQTRKEQNPKYSSNSNHELSWMDPINIFYYNNQNTQSLPRVGGGAVSGEQIRQWLELNSNLNGNNSIAKVHVFDVVDTNHSGAISGHIDAYYTDSNTSYLSLEPRFVSTNNAITATVVDSNDDDIGEIEEMFTNNRAQFEVNMEVTQYTFGC